MLFWIANIVGLALAYLLGATPTAWLAGKALKGIDIREHGSRSVGATNALRTLGWRPALIVLVLDVLKGAAAIALIRWLLGWLDATPGSAAAADLDQQAWAAWAVCGAGLAAVLGHSRSIWLGFTGGKSAATGLGVLLAMSWPVGLGAAAAFAGVLTASRIASLSSMAAALAAVVAVCVLEHPAPYRVLVIAGAVYVIARHRANIGRLLAGTEPRLGGAGPKASSQA